MTAYSNHSPTARRTGLAALLLGGALLITACSPGESPADDPSSTGDAAAIDETAGIDWFDGSVEEAFAAAEREDKPLFLYWGAEWCPYCKQVKATIFTRRDVIRRTRQFVAVELDGDDPAAQQAGEGFGVAGYPTMIVFMPDGEELTRIPNGLNLEAYADIFDLALNAIRPVADLVRAALAGESLEDREWQQLAVYSWGQDNQRALGEFDVRDVFGALANACPGSAGSACSRLAMNHIEAAIDAAGDTPLDSAIRDAAVDELMLMLEDERLIAANLDAVLHAGTDFTGALTESGSEARARLADHWQAVMASLADDPRLSTVEQFYAAYGPVGFLRLDDPEAVIPEGTQDALRDRVAKAMANTTDPIERHVVTTTAASLLRAVDLPDEASVLLEGELAQSRQPYYLMSVLASTAEANDDNTSALSWRKRAYETATGESTRFRWGYGYVVGLIRLAPESTDEIEAVTAQMFAELEDPATAFYGGTGARAERLSSALLEWANSDDNADDRVAALARLREKTSSVCAAIPPDEAGRERCDGFLEAPDGA